MAELLCPTHNKYLKANKYGYYCPTPVQKDAAGNTTEWCDYKPGQTPISEASSSAIEMPSETLAEPQIHREPIKETDWDEIARGKVRCALVGALIQKRGLEPITIGDAFLLEGWVKYIFNGMKEVEDLSNEEITQLSKEID